MFKYINEVPPSDDWFPYKYIDSEVNKQLDLTKRGLAGNEIEMETKNYVEYLNHDTNWLKTITIKIYKFLINSEYINFFIIMYMQWKKDNGSTSFSRKFIIPCMPSFEKLHFSQFKLYIITETITQCFVCRNFKNNILIRAAEGKEKVFCILHMLRTHTGLQNSSKKKLYDLHIKQ